MHLFFILARDNERQESLKLSVQELGKLIHRREPVPSSKGAKEMKIPGLFLKNDSKIYLYDCVKTSTQEKQKHSDRPAPGCCRILFTDELCQGQQHQALGQLYSSGGTPHWNYFYTLWIYLFSTNCLMSRSSALSPARFLAFCALTTLASSLSILSSSFSTGVRICSRHCPRCRQQHRLCSARRVQHPQGLSTTLASNQSERNIQDQVDQDLYVREQIRQHQAGDPGE